MDAHFMSNSWCLKNERLYFNHHTACVVLFLSDSWILNQLELILSKLSLFML
jgi:hypothetical protein